MSEIPNIRAAAVLYTQFSKSNALSLFASQMKDRGWRVGGVVQDILMDASGAKVGVDAVALDTGDRFPIVRPSKQDLAAGTCGLDRSALAESSAALRRAIDEKADLIVVEKFGEREQFGEGLSEGILHAMAEGIPVLVAVPAGVIDKWSEFTGGLGQLLPSDLRALQQWWDRDNLYRELIHSVPAEPVNQVIVGLNWILVEGQNGCGLAHTPSRGTGGCRRVPSNSQLMTKSLKELAELAISYNPFETALGIAAINAHYNRYDLKGEETNGLEAIGTIDGPVTVVGAFKKIEEKFDNVRIVEINPTENQYPQSAAENLLKTSEAAVITASTLVNRSLPALLNSCAHNTTALVGPGTPLADCLFHYGIDILSGLIVENVESVTAIVRSGGSVKDLKPFCRYLTLNNE